jgi:hypothetical protein
MIDVGRLAVAQLDVVTVGPQLFYLLALLLGILGAILLVLAVMVLRVPSSSRAGPSASDAPHPPSVPIAALGAIDGRRTAPRRDLPASVVLMADTFDPNAMLERFRFRAQAVKNRPMPPIEGPGREEFKQQAKLDFMDYSILADGEASIEEGILTITVDLRPPS